MRSEGQDNALFRRLWGILGSGPLHHRGDLAELGVESQNTRLQPGGLDQSLDEGLELLCLRALI